MAETDLDVVVQCAVLAPSVHNTQPWRLHDAGGEVLEVFADPGRQLAFLDPAGRQLHISCGAAVEFGFLAARSLGRRCDVSLRPDPARPDLLATLALGERQPATDEETRLADAIPLRYTDRGPYDDRAVPLEVVADAERRATLLGAWVQPIRRPDDRGVLIAVLAAAEAAEAADPRYAEELARWTTTGRAEQGVPAAATAEWPGERVSDVPLRDFTGADRHRRPGDAPDLTPPTVERDTLLLIGTELDDPLSWLSAGRALGWMLLRAASDGLSAQPLGQAIDLPAGRERLRRELGLVGHPQFVLRLGYGQGQPWTGRRATGYG